MDAITVEAVTGPLPDADLAALVGSLAGLWRDDAGRHDPTVSPTWPHRAGADYYRDLLADPDGLVLAARAGDGPAGGIVGHLVGRFVAADDFRTVSTAVLESMQVSSDLRGQGVGGRLVDAFLAWAAERGSGRASVTANAGNTAAQAFYRRHGFVPAAVTLRRPVAARPGDAH
jgi:GNAT superfamily N-acetyltransferase